MDPVPHRQCAALPRGPRELAGPRVTEAEFPGEIEVILGCGRAAGFRILGDVAASGSQVLEIVRAAMVHPNARHESLRVEHGCRAFGVLTPEASVTAEVSVSVERIEIARTTQHADERSKL